MKKIVFYDWKLEVQFLSVRDMAHYLLEKTFLLHVFVPKLTEKPYSTFLGS